MWSWRQESSLFNSYYTGSVVEGATFFPGLLYFTLETNLIILSVKQESITFWIFGMTQSEIEPQSPGLLANTLSLSQCMLWQEYMTTAVSFDNHKNSAGNKYYQLVSEVVQKVFSNASNITFLILSLRVFELLFLSLLLFAPRLGRYVLQPSSGVCRTREPSLNFELRPLLNPRGSSVLIPLTITG